ncbi:MAG: hypothetical protein HY238_00435 [Acidobacteria bacterium]|nr:hypothetical protein [Acidobacteriota bacterium]
MTSPAAAFKCVLNVFNRLAIPYMVGGSLATSVHGVPRSTNDIDLVADVRPEHIPALFAELSTEFYADPEMMRQALRAGRMFNLIHYESSYKFDIYPVRSQPYYQAAFARRKLDQYSFEGREVVQFYVESPEDAILAKMVWYRAGNEISERQWSDILDVIRVQQDRLDLDYLRRWAQSLKVADLLERAILAPDS